MALLSYALTNLADVKESLGITDNSKDNLIERKINQATEMIENFCGLNNDHHFASTTYTNEEYDATNTDELVLRARPIITLTSVSARDSSENISSFTTLDSQDYFYDEYAGVIKGVAVFSGSWNRYRVTYTAGFATIPDDLAEACVLLASELVANADQSGSGVKSKQEGQRKVEYFQPNEANSGSLIEQLGIDDMLARYINYAV